MNDFVTNLLAFAVVIAIYISVKIWKSKNHPEPQTPYVGTWKASEHEHATRARRANRLR